MKTMTPAFLNVAPQKTRLWNRVFRVVLSWLVTFSFLLVNPGRAQVCTSPSNELTINQSFGSVGEPPAETGQSTYQFVTAVCPDNGQYTVATSVDGRCFNNAWHTVAEDHTPNDRQGNMLIVNASNETGAFYQQPLASLCANTRYEFSVWGLNLLRPGICSAPTLPNLIIRIETEAGRVLQTIDFGQLNLTPSPTWTRFSTLFTAPAVAEPVIVKLINNQEAGGCGNDLALDDIQLKPCESCPSGPALVPDAFTPNNDGRNDRLIVFVRDAVSYNLRIYNRWGSLVFASDATTESWDGTYAGSPCLPDEYSWVLTYRPAQTSPAAQPYVRKGQVLLLR